MPTSGSAVSFLPCSCSLSRPLPQSSLKARLSLIPLSSFTGPALTIAFDISESFIRTEHIRKHPTHDWNEKSYTYDFTGDLTLRISGWYDGRKSWADGKTRRLEDKLPQAIEGFLAAAEAMKRRSDERAEQHQRWEQEEVLRQQREHAARKEREFLEAALKEAESWRQANELRQYVQHLREVIMAKKVELTEYGHEWLRHAEEAAERMDPSRKWLGDE